MADPYTILGVPADADDAAVRKRYLELVRAFPPEQHPDRFAAVRSAYERVKDIDARARQRLDDDGRDESIEAIIEEATCSAPRRRFGLTTLLATLKPPAG